jgi:hypothetical protein
VTLKSALFAYAIVVASFCGGMSGQTPQTVLEEQRRPWSAAAVKAQSGNNHPLLVAAFALVMLAIKGALASVRDNLFIGIIGHAGCGA